MRLKRCCVSNAYLGVFKCRFASSRAEPYVLSDAQNNKHFASDAREKKEATTKKQPRYTNQCQNQSTHPRFQPTLNAYRFDVMGTKCAQQKKKHHVRNRINMHEHRLKNKLKFFK